MAYNLTSPHGISAPCTLDNLDGWFETELEFLSKPDERAALSHVAMHLDSFVEWPERALLLWPGCHRAPEAGKHHKYHSYPLKIQTLAKKRGIYLDRRANGPAIAAFMLSGGRRPARFGSSNAWSVHHLYSGKFPYFGRTETLHAAKDSLHFTQSAGLIAVHPVADALADEFPCFIWQLRAQAFLRFAYDPDKVFCADTDRRGFSIRSWGNTN